MQQAKANFVIIVNTKRMLPLWNDIPFPTIFRMGSVLCVSFCYADIRVRFDADKSDWYNQPQSRKCHVPGALQELNTAAN